MNWNVITYKKAINNVKEEGTLNGIPVKTREDIYEIISSTLYVHPDTAKGWTRPGSTGPGDEERKRDLEKLLGVPQYGLDLKKKEEVTSNMVKEGITEINKYAIYGIYMLMKDYLNDENMEYEECFDEMWNEIESRKILVPNELYAKIEKFVNMNLAPIVYEREKTYADCYTDEIGFYNEEGIWQIKDEEAMELLCTNFVLKNLEIEKSLDDFAEKEIQPYLV